METLQSTDKGDNFFGKIPQEQPTKAKLNKWDYIKLRSLWITKEMMSRMKIHLTEQGENICKSPDRGLIS